MVARNECVKSRNERRNNERKLLILVDLFLLNSRCNGYNAYIYILKYIYRVGRYIPIHVIFFTFSSSPFPGYFSNEKLKCKEMRLHICHACRKIPGHHPGIDGLVSSSGWYGQEKKGQKILGKLIEKCGKWEITSREMSF